MTAPDRAAEPMTDAQVDAIRAMIEADRAMREMADDDAAHAWRERMDERREGR